MAAVAPIFLSAAVAATLRSLRPDRKAAAPIVLVALMVMALGRFAAPESSGARVPTLPNPSQIANLLLRQQPAVRVSQAALDSSGAGTCVMVLGVNGKISVGFEDPKPDLIVSLSDCDLYNASREADSTELMGGTSLSARNIFLSGTYTLAPGATMSAATYLATHASPAYNPYARLEVPSYSGCTRTDYKLDGRRTETVSPGVYCGGIEVAGGAMLNLEPGIYILDRGNFAVSGNAIVRGAGVTIILASRSGSNYGTVDIRRGSTIAISAPADGAAGVPGIAIWIDQHAPSAGATLDGGNTQNINGAIYLPSNGSNIPEERPPASAAASWWRQPSPSPEILISGMTAPALACPTPSRRRFSSISGDLRPVLTGACG